MKKKSYDEKHFLLEIDDRLTFLFVAIHSYRNFFLFWIAVKIL